MRRHARKVPYICASNSAVSVKSPCEQPFRQPAWHQRIADCIPRNTLLSMHYNAEFKLALYFIICAQAESNFQDIIKPWLIIFSNTWFKICKFLSNFHFGKGTQNPLSITPNEKEIIGNKLIMLLLYNDYAIQNRCTILEDFIPAMTKWKSFLCWITCWCFYF